MIGPEPFGSPDVQALAAAQQEELEAAARGFGYRGLVLETGNLNHEALGLYASAGYEPIPCYGVYATRALSRCFEKRL